jgi:predicted ATP-dependent Lon-type protease
VAEELAEALIAWCILDREKKLIPAEEVKHRAEEYLKRTYGIEVEYEIGDALRKLEDRGLLINHHPGLNVLGLERSLKTLDKGWDGVFVP